MRDVGARADRKQMNPGMFATRLMPFRSLRLAVILAVLAAAAALVVGPGNVSASHSGVPGLSVSATCDGASATPGDTLTCRVRVSNTGGTVLTGLFLLHYPYQTDRPTDGYAGYPPLQLGELATHESLIVFTSYTVTSDDLPGPLVQTFGADSDQTAEVWSYAATQLVAPPDPEPVPAPAAQPWPNCGPTPRPSSTPWARRAGA